MLAEFKQCFKALTGNEPFPWQCELYQRFVADQPDNIPASCNLPTGLGKTSVVAIWLISLASRPDRMPRRLVYVVNRRTVVDQATDEARKLRDNLSKPELAELTKRLRSLCAIPQKRASDPPLAISTLRGQFADNGEWYADPTRPAIIVGTVDMIGSRLLFSGYGCGRYDRTHQVGLLGCNTLLIHDEAHLTDAFQQLLDAIMVEQVQEKTAARELKVLELTATTRHREGRPEPFKLSAKDELHPIVAQRLDAAKTIYLHPTTDVTGEVIKLAAGHKMSGRANLVFVQTPDQVNAVVTGLSGRDHQVPSDNIVTLTGTMRGHERDRLATENPVFARYLRDPLVAPAEGTVYLVCTSAGEVGVDISADDLECDLSTFESMAQRFGRVNRRGGINPLTGQTRHARIDIVHEPDIDTNTPRGERRKLTRILLQRLVDEYVGSASPRTLGGLPEKDKADAFSPAVPTLPATDILFDAWALTTITDDLPGRPPVAQWLHGIEPPDQPTTAFAWRAEVAWLAPPPHADAMTIDTRAAAIMEYLDEYPVKPHERLTEATARLVSVANVDSEQTGRRQHLKEFAKRATDLPAWLIDGRGHVTLTTVVELAGLDFRDLLGRTIVLPPTAGGLSVNGMLDGRAVFDPDRITYDVADQIPGDVRRTRYRTIESMNNSSELDVQTVADERPDEATGKQRQFKRVAAVSLAEDDEGESIRRFVACVAADSLEGEESRSRFARFQQFLDDHLGQAERYAISLVEQLLPEGPERTAVRLAAKWHDLGKDRDRWQHGVGNREPRPWAKSGRRGRIRGLNGYRHEFGSLLDVLNPDQGFVAELEQLENDSPGMKDLVLHLIAAHHGRARPHFPLGEAFDPNRSEAHCNEMARTTPQRFARLQRTHGRWGLAYLESLVRAADILASQKSENGAP